jgi:hypothetical protein
VSRPPVVTTAVAALALAFCAIAACVAGAASSADAPKDKLSLSPPRVVTDVEPGQRYTSHVTFRNYTEATFDARITTADLEPADEPGSFARVRPGQPRDAGTWITPQFERRRMEPGDEIRIPITVQVPGDASPGVHPGAVVVSRIIAQPGSSTEDAARVAVSASLASQWVFTVPGDQRVGGSLRRLRAPRVVWPSEQPRFRALVENDGNTLLTAKPEIGIGAFTGRAAQTLKGTEVQLLPGSTREVEISWNDRPLFGWFRPTIFVEAGSLRMQEDYPIVFVLPPWWVIALLVAAVVLPIWTWWRRRRRRR